MNIWEFIEFIIYLKKIVEEEKLREQWLHMLPQMDKYRSFEEFKDIMTGANIDLRPADEIEAEIERAHAERREKLNGAGNI